MLLKYQRMRNKQKVYIGENGNVKRGDLWE